MLKIFKKIKYTIIAKAAEQKFKRKYGCKISIKVKDYEVRNKHGKTESKIKTEITVYEKDCKKLIKSLLTKSSH